MKREIRRMSFKHRLIAFIVTYIVLLLLGSLPAILYSENGFLVLLDGKPLYVLWYCLYWFVFTTLFFAFTTHQEKTMFEVPIERLGEAAKKVAGGDFSVYLQPMHTPDHYGYIDYMFEDFNRMVKELGSIETLKSDFINNVSHEIKTPLSVIQNYATVLQSGTLTEEQSKQYAATISDACARLTTMVTNILKLSKLENQSILPEKKEYDLPGQLCDAVLAFETEWSRKDIDFSVDVEERLSIKQDRPMLDLVWRNLISNAIRYTPENGKIHLEETFDAKHVVVRIKDTGCGISPVALPHIFDKFYQEDKSGHGQGNGLGLAMVKKSLDIAGGTIAVESEKGRGSTFTVTLPR